ncbi:MAG: hypothetical protein K5695_17395 [Oscillospiraceae bacterium]|nr:hypothetical protein [Oscillospiraceae bacterium]
MSKELDALYSNLLKEISEQEKRLPEPPPVSEDAQRRAEQIAQDVEDDGSWQIPPEEPKPVRPKPLHAPVIVPPPISHFTDEPSQNPAVRMRDRLEEDALPKPDTTRKPTQIRSAGSSPASGKKKRRRADPGITDVRKQIQVKSTGAATGPAAPAMPEKKRTVPRIRIPDELPPDIPRVIPGQNDLPEDLDMLLEVASRKAEPTTAAIPTGRDAQVRSRAEQIKEQMRRRSEESDGVAVPASDDMQEPIRVPSRTVEHIPPEMLIKKPTPPAPAPSEDEASGKGSFFSKVKVFMTDFLDLHDDDEEEEEPKPRRPKKKAAVTAGEKPETKPEADEPKKKAVPAFLNAFRKKRKDGEDTSDNGSGASTDWRNLVSKPGNPLKKQPVLAEEVPLAPLAPEPAPTAETPDDALERAYNELEMAETDTPLAEDKPQIPDEIIALLRVPGLDVPPSQQENRRMFSAEDFLQNDPLSEPAHVETPVAEEESEDQAAVAADVFREPESDIASEEAAPTEAPAPEAASVPEEPPAPVAPAPVKKPKKERRLRNLMSYDDDEPEEPEPELQPEPEPEPEIAPETPPAPGREPAPAPIETEETPDLPEPELPEEAPEEETSYESEKAEEPAASEGIASVFRDALDESPDELEEMKAEPLPEMGKFKVQFLRRHWYFVAGILCFILALVGLVTCIGWVIGKTRSFFGSSVLRESLVEVLYPVAVVDLPAFETTADLSSESLLSAAMVDILMYDDLSGYPVSFDVISIPANDVLARAQLRFGTDFTTEFSTLHAAGETFYYDSASGCYNVPAAPSIFSYSPDITDISRSGDTYTVTVRYVSEKASWQQRSDNFTNDNAKTMQVTLQQEDKNYRIVRIANVSEGGKES